MQQSLHGWLVVQESLQARPNSHELFGYDFVVDQALNVWLIEVNCSPSLEHSTPVTARLCTQMMDDLFKANPCPVLPCPALPWPALPWPALPRPALPCPALPRPALPCCLLISTFS